MLEEGLDKVVLQRLRLKPKQNHDLKPWNAFLERVRNPKNFIKIGLVGKYVELQDSYKSILESLIHAGAENETEIYVESLHSEYLESKNLNTKLENLDGLIVAPGFGERGIEGKIMAISYARLNNLPFLGICLGMQMAVIEYARNKVGLKNANSTEMVSDCKYPVIDLMESQKSIKNKGGTMRLGSWDCNLIPNTKSAIAYQKNILMSVTAIGTNLTTNFQIKFLIKILLFLVSNPETGLVEIIEYNNHPWFVGVQFHPEYKSTVLNPHPLFKAFVKASLEKI